MGLPTISQTWDFSKINQRRTFTTINDSAGFILFTWHRYLVDTLLWTVKYTCDGTTGPTSSSDHTDRLSAVNKCTTRGTSAAAAQSFSVLTDANGADHLLTYQGAGTSPTGDDLLRYAFSPTGAYTPAGTATNQPTATDEVLVANSLTFVGTGSNDRIFHIVGTTDKKNFRAWVYSNAVLQREFWAERVSSTVSSGFSWTDPLTAGQRAALSAANAGSAGGSLGASGAGAQGATGNVYAKIGTTIVSVAGAGETYRGLANSTAFSVSNPELNGGAPIVPLAGASNTTNAQGKVGNRVDVWFAYCNGIVDGDPFGSSPSFQFVYLNTQMVPWDGANAAVIQ